jgi:hypothetical protein
MIKPRSVTVIFSDNSEIVLSVDCSNLVCDILEEVRAIKPLPIEAAAYLQSEQGGKK